MGRILVTGSQGTIGRKLVAERRLVGHEVTGVDLQHQADQQYVRADIRSYRQLERVFLERGPFDVVYHLAAEFGRLNGEEYYETLWETNVIGTRHLLELQRRLGFKLIFASSSEIYGEMDLDWLSETSDAKGPIQQNDYAMTKWVNELQIRNAEARWGAECVRVRLFNAYGPGEYYHAYRSVVCLFCYRALHGLPWQVYENYSRVFMYVDDLIPTLGSICTNFKAGEVVNIGGREFRSVRELSDLILRETRADPKLVEYLPEEKHNVRNKRPVIEKAVAWLGHNPQVTLEVGVPRTLRWMREVYSAYGRGRPE